MPAIVAIGGPGGIGKSALAVHLAHAVADRYADGVLYIDLHGATDGLRPLSPLEALGRLLRSLGLDGSAVPTTVDEAAARYRSLTSARHVLLILDNALDTRQLRPLIPAGPGCAVVITSRQVLTAVDGASQLNLPELDPSESTALLARIAGPGRVHAEPEAAGRIVRLCGGLPLALRIAAARLAARPDWTLSYLADRLADATRRLDTLQHADLAVRASIAVSLQHLQEEPAGQDAVHLFALLGLLDTPTHTPAATTALADRPERTVADALDRLLDARLLESAGAGPLPDARPRPPLRPRTSGRHRPGERSGGRDSPRVAPLPRHCQNGQPSARSHLSHRQRSPRRPAGPSPGHTAGGDRLDRAGARQSHHRRPAGHRPHRRSRHGGRPRRQSQQTLQPQRLARRSDRDPSPRLARGRPDR
ncbi:NB-ARC domain-containing protein [Nonomuraea rubra]|uniref:NB-ARC domain-containing protein n=1 Tax=Nonomuraea rubra TaxID=46180 RepID=UPI003CD0BFAD